MRILSISIPYPPIVSGLGRVAFDLNEEWTRLGHHVEAAVWSDGAVEAAHTIHRPVDAAAVRRLADCFDVLVTHEFFWNQHPWLYLSRRPFVVVNHALSTPPLLSRAGLFRRVVHSRAAGLVAVSRYLAKTMPKRTRVIYNPVDLPDEDVGGDRTGQLLFVGRIAPGKGLDRLLRWMTRWEHPVPSLTVIGEGPMLEQCRTLAAEGNLRVQFLGAQPSEHVLKEMRRHRVVVIPSHPHGGWNEGLCLVAFEALASGATVVASEVGGLPEAVGESGLLVPCDDGDAWHSAVRTALADDSLRQRGLALFRERWKGWTLERVAREYLLLFEQILEKRRST